MFVEQSGARALNLEQLWGNYSKQKWWRPAEAVAIEVREKQAWDGSAGQLPARNQAGGSTCDQRDMLKKGMTRGYTGQNGSEKMANEGKTEEKCCCTRPAWTPKQGKIS